MAEDQLEARLRRRMQTATLSINSAFRLTLWTVLNEVPNISDISGHFAHVVFVRLSTQESYLLDEEIFKWGFNEWHTERQHAEEIASRPPDDEESEFLNTVAAYLFYYWSWANSVMRNVLALHKASKEVGLDGAKLLSLLASNLATRSDDTFVADSRRSRVNELLNDEANAKFFATLRANPEDTLADVKQIAIAPHPADLCTWRLLAYQVQKMQHHLVLRSWPGVHWAAWKAAYLKGEDVDCEAYYPFYDVWHPLVAPEDSEWDEDESRPSSGMPSSGSAEEELADTTASDSASEKSAPDPCSMFEDVENLLAASDVWDVWRLCKVVLCGTAYQGVDQEPGTEYLFRKLERYLPFKEFWTRTPVVENSRDELLAVFQRMQPFEKEIVLGHGYISAKYEQVRHYWPLPLPYQFIDFWDYSNFSFREVPEAVAKQLLRELDLDATENAEEIDLVCLLGCKRHPFRTTEDLQSFRHTIYLTDDIQQKWAGGMDFPGQYYPCNCEDERLWSRVPEDDRKKARYFQDGHFSWDHLGGNTVFRRSKLDPSNFCRELDRYWDDWNDCALIFGKGETEDLDIIDGDTIYILESLPGVKARQLKASTPDREAGLLLACAYFEEKWAARQSTRSSM